MSVTIVAASLQTESGDSYLFLYDQLDGPEEFIELIEKSMGEELEYVWNYELNVLHGNSQDYADALRERINELQENA